LTGREAAMTLAGEPVGRAFERHRDGSARQGELGLSPGVNDEDLALVAQRAGELARTS